MAEFIRPNIIKRPWTNGAYGIPRGQKRRNKPHVLAVIHISGNARTAGYTDPLEGARAEISYMDRKGSNGPTGHVTVARDGTVFWHLDPAEHTAWLNGDALAPNTRLPGVARLAKARAQSGTNYNEGVHLEGETVGGGKYQINDKQIESWAFLIARESIRTGLPIKFGDTILGHQHINTVNRPSDPFPKAISQAQFDKLIARAKEWKTHLQDKPAPEPAPIPDPEPGDEDEPNITPEIRVKRLRRKLDAAMGAAEDAEARHEQSVLVIAGLEAKMAVPAPEKATLASLLPPVSMTKAFRTLIALRKKP